MYKFFLLFAFTSQMIACGTFGTAQTTASEQSGYTYVPVDPFSVDFVGTDEDEADAPWGLQENERILRSLPDNTVRVSIQQIMANGGITYGPATANTRNSRYRLIVDYVNSDTHSVRLWIFKFVAPNAQSDYELVSIYNTSDQDVTQSGLSPVTTYYVIDNEDDARAMLTNLVDFDDNPETDSLPPAELESLITARLNENRYDIPIYIGIGLRVTADIRTNSANVDISGLGVLGGNAQINRLSGTLVVQTLGVNGETVSGAIPIQSELNRTTAQNAVTAIGSIRPMLYDTDNQITPRVVGLYLPFPSDVALVNGIISQISSMELDWQPPNVSAGE